MRRSLTYFWRPHLALVLGAAVTTAVLTGALIVGDSLRGSLRDLALDRLGRVDWALAAERPFRQSLADDLAARQRGEKPVGVLTLRASATAEESGARASKVTLWGVDGSFFRLHGDTTSIDLATRSGAFPTAAVSRALASELGVGPGSDLVLAFERPSDFSRETLVGREESLETVGVLRVTVSTVLPDRGLGGFALEPSQARPLNVFVDLGRLQRVTLGRGVRKVNVLLGPVAAGDRPTVEDVEGDLNQVLRLEDIGLILKRHGDVLSLQSEQFVIDDLRAQAASAVARELGIPAQPVLTHIANSISIGERSIPYSTITALDPPTARALGSFRLLDGQNAPRLATDEILLNRWAAEDLGAVVGDPVEIVYYALGLRDELTTESRSLRLRGIVEMAGIPLDPHLTPEFPGVQDAADISAWDPPFPVDLDRIRPRDEEYWDLHRAAPKAFVSTELGRELWSTRFGSLTSLRLAPAPDGTAPAAIEDGLRRRMTPRAAGLVLRPLREEALRAARGATDFAGLFLGLSLFLIVSAALLAGLLFRLGVEQRSAELGLLRATGFPLRSVRRRFLAEGLLLAALGAVLGLGGGAAYAWVLLAGLRTWWLPAIGEPVLFLHVAPTSLALGGVISMAVVGLAIAGALRHLKAVPIVSLLAGEIAPANPDARPSRRALWMGSMALVVAGGLSIAALTADAHTAAGLAFGVGATLLVGGVALFSHFSGHPTRRANGLGQGGRAAMALRSSGRNQARSRLCVALMACASFVIVVVAANRVHSEIDVAERTSGAGGFTLVAETDVPLYSDLGRESPAAAAILGAAQVVPFRLLPGEDVSCLNLYQPERPRILGAPVEMVARGGFSFQQMSMPRDNPWQLLEEDLGAGVVPAIGDYNSVLWILHSGLGEDLVVENERGEPVRLRFVALLTKSLFQSEIVISEANFQRHFPSRTGYSYFLLDPEPTRAAEVAAGLESELVRLGFDAVATKDRLAAFQAVEDTYLSTFQTLGGLGLLLGTLGMGVILLRNVLERRSELAALRALGFRRSHLRGMVLMENAFLLLVGLAVGAAAGGAAAAPRLVAAGQDLPWLTLSLTLASVFAVGMLASTFASRAVTRLPLLASLQAK